MQCTAGKEGELAKRTRYYQSIIDMDMLGKGETYLKLKPSYIIFICTFDLFGKGLPIYTFINRCSEDNKLELGDETTKLFLNSKSKMTDIEPEIAAFLRYVDGHAPQSEFTKELDEEVRKVKANKEWRQQYMTYAMELKVQGEREREEGRQEGREEGRQEGLTEGRTEGRYNERRILISSMLHAGLRPEKISQITNISLQEVNDIKNNNEKKY